MRRKMELAIVLGMVLALGAPARGAPAKPNAVGGAGAAAAKAVTETKAPAGKKFTAQPAAGEVSFTAVGRPSLLKIVGKAKGPEGAVLVDGGKLSGEFKFDLRGLETGISMRDTHMKDKYLEVGKYPEAVLKLKDVPYAEGATTVPFTGSLLLHGVEKPISGTAKVEPDAAGAKVASDFEIKTTDFGIEIPKYMGITVTESVKVSVNLHAQAAP
jgi:polyisoprenoid-binding protein YceI